MFYIDQNKLHSYIKEDLPYYDLTTMVQEAGAVKAKLEIFTREDIIISCMDEVCKIAQILDVDVIAYKEERQKAVDGEVILTLQGSYEKLHRAWRTCQNLLEYSCAIATYTDAFVKQIRHHNPNCQLLATRKTFPFAKEFCIKSVINGGGMIHRLNLSETILFFQNHKILYKNNNDFLKAIDNIKMKLPEKMIIVEVKTLKEGLMLLDADIDVIQTDKLPVDELLQLMEYKTKHTKKTKITAAGGINKDNVKSFVQTGIDGIVTSSVYNVKIADLGCKISIL